MFSVPRKGRVVERPTAQRTVSVSCGVEMQTGSSQTRREFTVMSPPDDVAGSEGAASPVVSNAGLLEVGVLSVEAVVGIASSVEMNASDGSPVAGIVVVQDHPESAVASIASDTIATTPSLRPGKLNSFNDLVIYRHSIYRRRLILVLYVLTCVIQCGVIVFACV